MPGAVTICFLLLAAGTPAPAADPSVRQLIADFGLEVSSVPSRDLPGWRPPRRVIVRRGDPERLAALRAVAPGTEIVSAATEAEAIEKAAGTDVLIGFCSSPVLAAAPEVRWIQAFSAGTTTATWRSGPTP